VGDRTAVREDSRVSLEERKAIVRWGLLLMWNEGNLDVIDEALAPDAVIRAGIDGDLHGPDGLRELVDAYRTAFPDLRFAIRDQVAEGDLVVTRYTASGTHLGDLGGSPGSGRRTEVDGVNVCRFEEAKIVEAWETWDVFTLVRDLGLPRRWSGARRRR
jgi:steroid delta-isomerase-like uncharacterized protein